MLRRPSSLLMLLLVPLLVMLACPDPSWAFLDFSKDALKSTGIVIGITAGAILLVVLIAGTMKDIKERKGQDVDLWADIMDSRTLAYMPDLLAGPLFVEDLKQALASTPPALPPTIPGFPMDSSKGCGRTNPLHPILLGDPFRNDIRAESPDPSAGRRSHEIPMVNGRFTPFLGYTASNGWVE